MDAIGVHRNLTITDFLASNESVPALRERILLGIAARGDVAATNNEYASL